MHILNQYFDKIYCITVASFHDRHQLVREQLKDVDFEWMFSPSPEYVVPFNKLLSAEVSLILGTMSCIDNAKHHGYKKIAIWEDDGVLTASEAEMRLFFREIPEEWDCLYMGNASWTPKEWMRTESFSPNACRIKWGTGSSFNAIQSHKFDLVKEIALKCECSLDFSYYQIFQKGNSYAPVNGFFSDPISSIEDKFYNPKPPEGKVFLPTRIVHWK